MAAKFTGPHVLNGRITVMKIHNAPHWLPAAAAAPARPAPASGARSFGRLLDELRQPDPPAATSAAAAAPADSAPGPEGAALQEMEASLELLERYRERLSQSRFRLRDLEPLVASLEAGLPALERELAALPPDSALKPLLQETMVLGAAESARFRRGDYLDA
jgi:hypothetical protein